MQYLAEKAGAYWLLDKIACLQLDPKIRVEEFQVCRFHVMDDRSARLVCDEGSDNGAIIYSEDIDFTDVPLDQITIWVEDDVILLPSEH